MKRIFDGLDLGTILVISLGYFAFWLIVVILVTGSGYPGVICVTPFAWLIALRVGLDCAAHSHSILIERRLKEASLAGGLYGLLLGILFWVLALRIGDIRPSEQIGMAVIIAFVLLAGILAGALLSWYTAARFERRRRQQP